MISNFSSHKHDDSITTVIPFGARINLNSLCDLTEIAHPGFVNNESSEFHNENLDFFILMNEKPKLLKWEKGEVKKYLKTSSILNFNISDENRFVVLPGANYLSYPKNDDQNLEKVFIEHGIRYDSPKIIGLAHSYNWMYKTSYKLIDAGGIYRFRNSVKADGHAPNFTKTESLQKLGIDSELYRQVYLHTGYPEFVEVLVDQFLKEVFGEKQFIGVHWRFDEGDFFAQTKFANKIPYNENDGVPKKYVSIGRAKGLNPKSTAALYKTIHDPEYFLDLLIPHVEENLSTNNSNTKIKTIFIASPVSTSQLFQQKSSYKNYKIFTTSDTHKFLKNILHKQNCTLLIDMFGDILSTFEKEILLRSLAFYRTRPSNWSFNVQGHRWANYKADDLVHDRVIFDVFTERNIKNKTRKRRSGGNELVPVFRKSRFLDEVNKLGK